MQTKRWGSFEIVIRSQRNDYIEETLNEVYDERKENNGVITDNLETDNIKIWHVRFDKDSGVTNECERKDPYGTVAANNLGKTQVKV